MLRSFVVRVRVLVHVEAIQGGTLPVERTGNRPEDSRSTAVLKAGFDKLSLK